MKETDRQTCEAPGGDSTPEKSEEAEGIGLGRENLQCPDSEARVCPVHGTAGQEGDRGMGRSTSLETGSRVCADAGMARTDLGPPSGRFCTAFTSAPSARTVWLEQVLGHHLAADVR